MRIYILQAFRIRMQRLPNSFNLIYNYNQYEAQLATMVNSSQPFSLFGSQTTIYLLLKGKSKTDKTNSRYVSSIQEEHFLTRKSNLLYLVHSRRIRNNYFISIKGKGKDKTSFSNVHAAQDEHLLRREPTNLHKK